MQRHRVVYLFILITSVGMAVGYWHSKNLSGRLQELEQSEQEIEDAKREIVERERELSKEEQRAQSLVNDPVEVEAAIRQIKRGVRDGETVFRVEQDPSQAAVPSVEPPAGAQP